MSVRLAFGITTGPGVRCWLPTSGGKAMPRPAGDRAGAHPPGLPVVVGPADAKPEAVWEATKQLVSLVSDGTEVAAGAGVDLGGGFTSARLAGAYGDRRDAVLAALRVLGVDGASRLGDRTSTLVALFGPSATKRVGAAANEAIADQRWAALQLASAASDLLGPEQLERVLDLRSANQDQPLVRGAASTLADHLSRVLAGYPRPRRLALVISLWEHVCAQLAEHQRRVRRAASQTRTDRIDKLRERHRDHLDEPILQQLRWGVGDKPTLAAAARWQPPKTWAKRELSRLLSDALAATVLLRFARTMSDEGLAIAAEQHRDELVAADALLTEQEQTAARRRPKGAYSHPARPGCYIHDLIQPLRPGRTITSKTETYVRERVVMARNYGVVVFDAVADLVEQLEEQPLHNCWDTCRPWQAGHLREWRTAVGFRRAPNGWDQPPLRDAHADGPTRTLSERIAAAPAEDPASVEAPHDLLWFADLADALAPFYGNDSATVRHERLAPALEYDTPAEHPAASIPLVVAGVAQLVAFGATPPPRCGSWSELVDGVNAAAAVAESSVTDFPIPAELSDIDKQVVPGTKLSVELGRNPRQLAGWSGYMGNCIGQTWYAEQAQRGQCVLLALRDPADGPIIANLDIRQRTGGWQINELRARFNETVAPALEKHIKRWVAGLPRPEPEPVVPAPPPIRSRVGSSRRSAAARLPSDLTAALIAAVEQELASPPAASARRTYAALARGLGRPGQPADFEPNAAVVALKRVGSARHVELLRAALAAGPSVPALWQATRVRPLASAVSRLDPALRKYDRLETLTDGSPLPRTLRALVRHAEIAPAYAMDMVARAVRTAIGALATDYALARSVARSPSPELVCVIAIAATCAPESTMEGKIRVTAAGTTTVPGFPATKLFDENGPWQQAMAAAADLGAPVHLFGQRIGDQGLLVPAALLGKGGWPALWRRAHR